MKNNRCQSLEVGALVRYKGGGRKGQPKINQGRIKAFFLPHHKVQIEDGPTVRLVDIIERVQE